MKRSTINLAILCAKRALSANNFTLPEYAYWDLATWKENRDQLGDIAKIMLGWDVTDFGSGAFDSVGAVLYTIRNGDFKDSSVGTPYAEKIIYLNYETGQEIPFHYHKMKTEDIINRAGGTLMLELYHHTPDNRLDENREVVIKMDGMTRTFAPGESVEVKKGCSITLSPGLFHRIWAKEECGPLIIGEVSSINDDRTDNIFLDAADRFSKIEEDEAPLVPLCNEYRLLF